MSFEQKATKKPLFYPITHEEVLDLKDLTGVEIKVFLYVRTLDPFGDRNLEYSVTAVADELGLSKGAVSKAIGRLQDTKLLPKWVKVRSVNTIEKSIRDRLHSQLNGLVEVTTSADRIDLLTDTEIIEVKAIKDWKAALGQVLVYSAFYPEHQKRIHLFGSAFELKRLLDIEAACLGFEVKVTGEEVQNDG